MISGSISAAEQRASSVTLTGAIAQKLRSGRTKQDQITGQEVFDAFRRDFLQDDGNWKAISKDQLNDVLQLLTNSRFSDREICLKFLCACCAAMVDGRRIDQDRDHPQHIPGKSVARHYQRLALNLGRIGEVPRDEMEASLRIGGASGILFESALSFGELGQKLSEFAKHRHALDARSWLQEQHLNVGDLDRLQAGAIAQTLGHVRNWVPFLDLAVSARDLIDQELNTLLYRSASGVSSLVPRGAILQRQVRD